MHSVMLKERNRMFLVEKQSMQPEKSVFNIGDARHNNHMRIESNNNVPVSKSPARFIQWDERANS